MWRYSKQIYRPLLKTWRKVDWERCFVCQQTTKETLQCPANSKRSGAGYETFANNINSFKQLGCMPVAMIVLASGTDSSLSELFKPHRAKWHKKVIGQI